jgi:hypothetical protein
VTLAVFDQPLNLLRLAHAAAELFVDGAKVVIAQSHQLFVAKGSSEQVAQGGGADIFSLLVGGSGRRVDEIGWWLG